VDVLPCSALPKVGDWEKITPAGADPSSYNGYGVSSLAVDPQNAGTVYIGNSPNDSKPIGIWKSSDCGATWIHVNTGKNGGTCGWKGKQCSEVLDHGRQWTFEIDPVNPQVLYTNNGYGPYDNGLMKSANGGVDWEQSWPQCSDKKNCWNTKDAPVNKLAPGFLGDVVMDPYDHNHLLIDFHADCTNVAFCVGESKDAGATWKIIDGDRAMGSAHESRLGFLENSSTWVFIAGAIWRTADSGASWKKVSDGDGGGMLYRAKDNTFYLGAAHAIYRSPDGVAWTKLPNSGTIIQGLIGDGTTIYSSSFAAGFKVGDNLQPYVTSPETDGMTWTPMTSPGMGQGAIQLGIDKSHHVMYSANGGDGFWRVHIP
jgi:hypothetical protein